MGISATPESLTQPTAPSLFLGEVIKDDGEAFPKGMRGSALFGLGKGPENTKTVEAAAGRRPAAEATRNPNEPGEADNHHEELYTCH